MFHILPFSTTPPPTALGQPPEHAKWVTVCSGMEVWGTEGKGEKDIEEEPQEERGKVEERKARGRREKVM